MKNAQNQETLHVDWLFFYFYCSDLLMEGADIFSFSNFLISSAPRNYI